MLTLLLASKSPRRQSLLSALGLPVRIVTINVDETLTTAIDAYQVPEVLAQRKADAFDADRLQPDEVLITADTIVVNQQRVLGKPHSTDEARAMLHSLSGHCHDVVTGVCLTTAIARQHFSERTRVWFSTLSDDEIAYYLRHYQVLDKAGAYGIQEWIGMIGINRIEGCYYNVMGLPIAHLWSALKGLCPTILSCGQ